MAVFLRLHAMNKKSPRVLEMLDELEDIAVWFS
jgi:hypothetical protein